MQNILDSPRLDCADISLSGRGPGHDGGIVTREHYLELQQSKVREDFTITEKALIG